MFNILIATVGMSSSLFYYLIRSYLTPHSDSSVMFADCNINKIKTSLQAQNNINRVLYHLLKCGCYIFNFQPVGRQCDQMSLT